MDSLNVEECKTFQAGKKLVAIISAAASTGVLLLRSPELCVPLTPDRLTLGLQASACTPTRARATRDAACISP